jgi:heme exporter protein A
VNGARITGRSLTRRFGHAVALDQLNLDLAPGESLAVLGPNGAGKSTLLRLLAGLARPNAGTIEIDGEPAHRRSARRRIGYIGHATLLYPALTARENLVFAARLYQLPDPATRAAQLLEEADLGAVADEQVAGFSRGMAQRVAIARGLVHDPALLLLDEPFTGLDRSASERLLLRLASLHSDGRSLILVTHDLAHAAQLADASLVLANGRSVHTGRGEDAASLEHAYLAAVERAA